MKTPVEHRGLVATMNMARLVQGSSQHVSIPASVRYNFGSNDFTISFILTNCTDGIIFQVNHADGTNLYMGRTSANGINIVVDTPTGSQQTMGLSGLPLLATSSLRLTLVRIGTTLKAYVNNRPAGTGTLGASEIVDLSRANIILGKQTSGTYTNGGVKDFLVLVGKGMTAAEITELHLSNVPPASTHAFIVAHYPLNETVDSVGHDVVEQYNYAKKVLANYGPGNINESSFLLATNLPGTNTATKINGSDADGDYVEFEFTAFSSGYLGFIIPGANQGLEPYVLNFEAKIISTTPTHGFGLTLNNASVNQYLQSIYGNTKFVGNFSVQGTGNNNFYIYFASGAGSVPVGSKFRLYKLYIRSTLVAQHADLINYSNTEVGIPNQLLQTGWHDLYDSKKIGKNYLTFNPITPGYGIVPSFSLTTSAWTLYLDVIAPTEPLPGGRSVFFNQTSAFDSAKYVRLYWEGSNQLYIYFGSNSPAIRFYVPGRRYRILILANPSRSDVYLNDGFTITTVSFAQRVSVFQAFTLGYDTMGGLVAAGGFGRFLFAARVITDREVNKLYNNQPISNTLFDVDLGDVFLNTNYYARDNSGNNRHLLLNSYVPAVDLPILINQKTSVPDRKALRLVRSSSHYIEVGGFTPSKEKGYTVVCVFGLDTDRNFGGALQDVIWGKRHSGGSVVEYLFGQGSKELKYYNGGVLRAALDFKKTDGLISLGTTWKDNFLTYYVNGVGVNSYGPGLSGFVKGFNDDLSNTGEKFFIGFEGGHYFNGYMTHFSLYKGILTPKEIQDIIYLNQPPHRLWSDCQLYINFEEMINDAGTYKLKDWSPQNRTVLLKNYTANEINPAHADYKIIDPETLIDPSKKVYNLPSDVLAKTWGWYDINDRRQLRIGPNKDEVTGYYNKLGNTARDFLQTVIGSAFCYRRYSGSNFYTCAWQTAMSTQGINPSTLLTKSMNWLHDGTTGWFVSFLAGGRAVFGSALSVVFTQTGGGLIGTTISVFNPSVAGKAGIAVVMHNGTANVALRYIEMDELKLHLITVTFDPSLGSNNLKIYFNGVTEGSYLYGATGSLLAAFNVADSSTLPTLFQRQSEATSDYILGGETIVGNQVLTGGELTSLVGYYTSKYGTFPKT